MAGEDDASTNPVVVPRPAEGRLVSRESQALPPRLIDASDDTEAVNAFIAEYASSPATLRSYRLHVERLLMWLRRRNRSLRELSRDDVHAYTQFLRAPPAEWCGPKVPRALPDGTPNPAWRPFEGPLSPAAMDLAFRILNTLMGWLTRAGYVQANPMALARQRRRMSQTEKALRARSRAFTALEFQAINIVLRTLPESTGIERRRAARARLLVALGYYQALRVSEIASIRCGDFIEIATANGPRLFLRVRGKGGRVDIVAVNAATRETLARYRETIAQCGDTIAPASDPAAWPVAASLRDCREPLTARQITNVVGAVFEAAADLLLTSSSDTESAKRLRSATMHWLRHTRASDLADAHADPLLIQRHLRHATFATTQIYVHTDDARYHQAISAIDNQTAN